MTKIKQVVESIRETLVAFVQIMVGREKVEENGTVSTQHNQYYT